MPRGKLCSGHIILFLMKPAIIGFASHIVTEFFFFPCRCGPCQLMVPILNEVSETLKDKIAVVKIDTEKYPSLANKYQVEALPTFILFKDGKLWDRFVSLYSSNRINQS